MHILVVYYLFLQTMNANSLKIAESSLNFKLLNNNFEYK